MKFALVTTDSKQAYLLKPGKSAFVIIEELENSNVEQAALELAEWCKDNLLTPNWVVSVFAADCWNVNCNDPENLCPIEDDEMVDPNPTLVVYIDDNADAAIFRLIWTDA